MAYGTETIAPSTSSSARATATSPSPSDLVAQEGAVGVPSAFAGPSEVAVVADDTTPVDYAAIDLVVQAEHGPDGLAYLITWSEDAAHRDHRGGGPDHRGLPPPRRRSRPPWPGAVTPCWWTAPSRPWRWPTSLRPSTSS